MRTYVVDQITEANRVMPAMFADAGGLPRWKLRQVLAVHVFSSKGK